MYPKSTKETKKVNFLKTFKGKHTLLLDSSQRSRLHLTCNVLLVDVPKVDHELSPKKRQER